MPSTDKTCKTVVFGNVCVHVHIHFNYIVHLATAWHLEALCVVNTRMYQPLFQSLRSSSYIHVCGKSSQLELKRPGCPNPSYNYLDIKIFVFLSFT